MPAPIQTFRPFFGWQEDGPIRVIPRVDASGESTAARIFALRDLDFLELDPPTASASYPAHTVTGEQQHVVDIEASIYRARGAKRSAHDGRVVSHMQGSNPTCTCSEQ